jgi:hypothetical protein
MAILRDLDPEICQLRAQPIRGIGVPCDRPSRSRSRQHEQRWRSVGARHSWPIDTTPSEVTRDSAGDEIVRQLPHPLRRIERPGERGGGKSVHYRPHLAGPKAGFLDEVLLGARPFGALLGDKLLQDPRRDFTDRRLFDRLLDVAAHQNACVERRGARTAL